MSGVFRRPFFAPYYARPRRRPFLGYLPDITTGVDLDGSTYLTRGGDLTGNADGDKGYFAALVKFDNAATADEIIWSTPLRLSFRRDSSGIILVEGSDSSSNIKVNLPGTTVLQAGVFYPILASWDVGGLSTNLYVGDVDDVGSPTLNSGNIDYTHTDHGIGATPAGGQKMSGCIAELVYGQEYIDFSVTANRRKFFDADGNPVGKGSDGSIPTGTAPIVYQSGGAAQFATNFGSGGAFAEVGSPSYIDCQIPTFATLTVSISAAIAAQRELTSSISAAIAAPQTAIASVDAAVSQALTALASADAAVQAANTSTFSLEAALQAAMSESLSVDAVVAAVQTAAASLQATVSEGKTSSASIEAAVQAVMSAQASLEAVVQAAKTATASIDASITDPGSNTLTASISAAVQAVQIASGSLTAAILGSGSVDASISAGIAAVRSIVSSVDAVIARAVSLAASVDGAVLATMTATASLDARITAVATLSPSSTRTLEVSASNRTHTAESPSRSNVIPARTRSH